MNRCTGHARGFTLIELVMSSAIAALTATLVASGARALADHGALQEAKADLVSAMLEARRLAFLTGHSASVFLAPGSNHVTIESVNGSSRRLIGAGARIERGPARRRVSFRTSGLSDNATIALSRPGSVSEVTVIVNQRGMVR